MNWGFGIPVNTQKHSLNPMTSPASYRANQQADLNTVR